MANYPYISGQTAVIAAITQLRKGFPAKVDAGYLQRFDIAPANESYVISILRFLGLSMKDQTKPRMLCSPAPSTKSLTRSRRGTSIATCQ